MKYAIQNQGPLIRAYKLGSASGMEELLTANGLITRTEEEYTFADGSTAVSGDYFTMESTDEGPQAIPVDGSWFEHFHKALGGDLYQRIVSPCRIFEFGDPEFEEITFLLDTDQIFLDEEDDARYFNSDLYGMCISAAKDAVIVIHDTWRDAQDRIVEVQFGFISREEFEQNYTYCDPADVPVGDDGEVSGGFYG